MGRAQLLWQLFFRLFIGEVIYLCGNDLYGGFGIWIAQRGY